LQTRWYLTQTLTKKFFADQITIFTQTLTGKFFIDQTKYFTQTLTKKFYGTTSIIIFKNYFTMFSCLYINVCLTITPWFVFFYFIFHTLQAIFLTQHEIIIYFYFFYIVFFIFKVWASHKNNFAWITTQTWGQGT